MRISDLIAALNEQLDSHGNRSVCPKGDANSPAHSVYFDGTAVIVSDSYFDAMNNLFDFGRGRAGL